MKKRILLACGLLFGALSVIAQSNSTNDSTGQQEHFAFVQSLLANQMHLSNLANKPTGIQQRLIAQAKVTIGDGQPNIVDTSIYRYSGTRGSKYFVSSNGENYSWNFQSDFLNCLYNDMTGKLPDVFADSIISYKNGQPRDTFVAFYNAQNNFDSFFYYRNIVPGYRIMRTTHRYNANGKMTELKNDYSIDRVNFYDNDLRKFWYDNTNAQLVKDTIYTFSGTTWDASQATAYHYNDQHYLDSMLVYTPINDTFSLKTLVAIKYDSEGRITNISGRKRPQSSMVFTTYIDSLAYTGNVPDYTYFEATTIYQSGNATNSKVFLTLGSNNLPDSAIQLDLDVSSNTYSPYLYRKFYYNSFNNPDSITINYMDLNPREHYHFYYETYDDTPNPIGIKDVNKIEAFSIHPNPFSRQINIDWKAIKTTARISLVNGLGQTVFDVRKTLLSGNNSVELPALANGFYIITIQNEKGEIFCNKLLKQ